MKLKFKLLESNNLPKEPYALSFLGEADWEYRDIHDIKLGDIVLLRNGMNTICVGEFGGYERLEDRRGDAQYSCEARCLLPIADDTYIGGVTNEWKYSSQFPVATNDNFIRKLKNGDLQKNVEFIWEDNTFNKFERLITYHPLNGDKGIKVRVEMDIDNKDLWYIIGGLEGYDYKNQPSMTREEVNNTIKQYYDK